MGLKHPDLFDDRYPHQPGHRRRSTSRAAAEHMRPKARSLRDRCYAVLERGPATADEVAGSVGETVLAIRPRITELAALGFIEDGGARRRNVSGRQAIVWRVRPPPSV